MYAIVCSFTHLWASVNAELHGSLAFINSPGLPEELLSQYLCVALFFVSQHHVYFLSSALVEDTRARGSLGSE